jgi:single-stranded DNA-specific DHH superfamily exonuclease
MNLIIHHWDTDGICSAALIASIVDGWRNISPKIGNFSFDERVWKEVERAERVFVADLNLRDVRKIKRPTLYFDHHLQDSINRENIEHINPVLKGFTQHEFPSASWVVSSHFGIWNHLSALGAVGDAGTKLFSWDIGSEVERLLKKAGLSKNDAIKLSRLIDTNYIIMDQNGVERAVVEVMNAKPEELLQKDSWLRNLEVIEDAVKEALSEIEVRDNRALIEFDSNFNVISIVARKAVWELGYDAALVINRDFNGLAQIYFRVRNPDRYNIPELIQELKSKFNAGGKNDVLGMICKPDEVEKALLILEEKI